MKWQIRRVTLRRHTVLTCNYNAAVWPSGTTLNKVLTSSWEMWRFSSFFVWIQTSRLPHACRLAHLPGSNPQFIESARSLKWTFCELSINSNIDVIESRRHFLTSCLLHYKVKLQLSFIHKIHQRCLRLSNSPQPLDSLMDSLQAVTFNCDGLN